MSKYKLIATDLDGTLLNSSSEVSLENTEAISRLYSLGIPVIPTTGRSLYEIPKSLFRNKEIRYLLTSNGAAIYDREADEFTLRQIEKPELDYLSELVFSTESLVCIHLNGNAYIQKDQFDDYERYNITKYYHDALVDCDVFIDDMRGFISSLPGIEKFIAFFASDDELDYVIKELSGNEAFNVTAAEKHSIEVTARSAPKGIALREFAESRGVDMHSVIAVGDSGNDAAMLSAAGLALAVSNASQSAKEVSDRVICSNNEHVIKYILENIIESE